MKSPLGRKTTRLSAGLQLRTYAGRLPGGLRAYKTILEGDPVWAAEHEARIQAHEARVAADCDRLGINHGDTRNDP